MLSAVSIVNFFSVYSFENYKLSHKSIIYHLTVEISKIISFYQKLITRKSLAAIIISLFCSYSDLDGSVSVLASPEGLFAFIPISSMIYPTIIVYVLFQTTIYICAKLPPDPFGRSDVFDLQTSITVHY